MMTKPVVTLNLPHDPLTKINGNPTCTSVIHHQCEICENAMSVHSSNGGGQQGHVVVIMPPATHNATQNTLPWIDPPNLGALTACQIAIAKDTHDRKFDTNVCTKICAKFCAKFPIQSELMIHITAAEKKLIFSSSPVACFFWSFFIIRIFHGGISVCLGFFARGHGGEQ
jgi:hypothetical protein